MNNREYSRCRLPICEHRHQRGFGPNLCGGGNSQIFSAAGVVYKVKNIHLHGLEMYYCSSIIESGLCPMGFEFPNIDKVSHSVSPIMKVDSSHISYIENDIWKKAVEDNEIWVNNMLEQTLINIRMKELDMMITKTLTMSSDAWKELIGAVTVMLETIKLDTISDYTDVSFYDKKNYDDIREVERELKKQLGSLYEYLYNKGDDEAEEHLKSLDPVWMEDF